MLRHLTLLLLLSIGLAGPCSADHDHHTDLLGSVDWLIDSGSSLSISQVRQLGDERFHQSSVLPLPQGFQSAPIWIRFRVPEDFQNAERLILIQPYALNDDVTLYNPRGDGRFDASRAGDRLPFEQREFHHRYPAFELTSTADHYYLRIQSSGSLQIPLYLMSEKAYLQFITESDALVGGYHGLMLVLVICSFVAYFMMKEKVFLLYALYLLAHQQLQFTLNGLSFAVYWPDFPAWANVAPATLVAVGILFATLFVTEFLDTEKRTPIVHRVFQTLLVINVLAIPLALFGDYQIAAAVTTGSGIALALVSLLAGFIAFRQGYRPARFLLAGWSAFLIGMVITGLAYSGIAPPTGVYANAMQIGSTFEVLILILALADRIALARSEQTATILRQEKELLEINHELEEQVNARTKELEDKNRQLSELATQDGLTGLLNHKFVLSGIDAVLADARRYHYPVAVLMIDIDHFKLINDRLGHSAGDKVLVDVAESLRSSCRQSDVVGRYGGDEFIMALSHAGASEAMPFAERLRLRINRIPVGNDHGTLLAISIGIAIYDPENGEELSAILEAADGALYQAKFDGRNRINLADTELSLVKSS